jgi:hypothetical protein
MGKSQIRHTICHGNLMDGGNIPGWIGSISLIGWTGWIGWIGWFTVHGPRYLKCVYKVDIFLING